LSHLFIEQSMGIQEEDAVMELKRARVEMFL